ncbi:HIT family protein [Ketogulonicigenium vulgare]|uniref:HIT family protein n=1 Tax=Ketogulonicigenium vulgare TaxID=92945 RepID=UPI00235A2A8A|nr:hypothetical protein [Ketogulonicigenium vulgare]
MNLIEERVAAARLGQNPYVLTRLPSGWVVIGDVQPLPGYCLLLSDPVVPSLNDLPPPARAQFMQDMALIGDALLAVTECFRVNYEIWGNAEPALHAHIMPRYLHEPDGKRLRPACMGYSWADAPKSTDPAQMQIVQRLRDYLAVSGASIAASA